MSQSLLSQDLTVEDASVFALEKRLEDSWLLIGPALLLERLMTFMKRWSRVVSSSQQI